MGIHWPLRVSHQRLMQVPSWALARPWWDPPGKKFGKSYMSVIMGSDQSCQEKKAGMLRGGVAGAGINFGGIVSEGLPV